MIPNTYDLPNAYRGDSYGPISIVIKDEFGNTLELDDCRAFLRVRNKKNNALVLEWSSDNGTATLNPVTDVIILSQVESCFMKMPAGEYLYDLQILDINSKRFTPLNGKLKVLPEVGCVSSCDCDFNGGEAYKIEKTDLKSIKDSFSISLKS